MRPTRRFVVRVLILAFILGGVAVVSDLAPRPASPYLSALADLAAGQPAVAQSCEYRFCPKEQGRKSPSCKRSTAAYNCQNLAGGGCQVTACF